MNDDTIIETHVGKHYSVPRKLVKLNNSQMLRIGDWCSRRNYFYIDERGLERYTHPKEHLASRLNDEAPDWMEGKKVTRSHIQGGCERYTETLKFLDKQTPYKPAPIQIEVPDERVLEENQRLRTANNQLKEQVSRLQNSIRNLGNLAMTHLKSGKELTTAIANFSDFLNKG